MDSKGQFRKGRPRRLRWSAPCAYNFLRRLSGVLQFAAALWLGQVIVSLTFVTPTGQSNDEANSSLSAYRVSQNLCVISCRPQCLSNTWWRAAINKGCDVAAGSPKTLCQTRRTLSGWDKLLDIGTRRSRFLCDPNKAHKRDFLMLVWSGLTSHSAENWSAAENLSDRSALLDALNNPDFTFL